MSEEENQPAAAAAAATPPAVAVGKKSVNGKSIAQMRKAVATPKSGKKRRRAIGVKVHLRTVQPAAGGDPVPMPKKDQSKFLTDGVAVSE